MRKVLHIAFSLWLAVLLLFGTTPKEFVHRFADHKDTVHSKEVKGLVLENEHHHCSFLGFHLMPFDNDIQLPRCPFPERAVFLPVSGLLALSAEGQTLRLRSLRGPPVMS